MSAGSKACRQLVKHISPPVGEGAVADVVVREVHCLEAASVVQRSREHVSS